MQHWMLSLAFVVGCRSVPQGPMGHHDDCHAALVVFANADANLKPLPAGCTLADAAKAMHAVGATSTGELGDPLDTFTVNFFTTPKLPEVHAWVTRQQSAHARDGRQADRRTSPRARRDVPIAPDHSGQRLAPEHVTRERVDDAERVSVSTCLRHEVSSDFVVRHSMSG